MNIPYPNLTGAAEQQLGQLKSYLYQVADILNLSLKQYDTKEINAIITESTKSGAIKETTDNNYSELKSLIIKTADTINSSIETIEKDLHGEYEAISSDFGSYKEKTDAHFSLTGEYAMMLQSRSTELEYEGETVTQISETYIKAGYLYDEKRDNVFIPVNGIAVGEITTRVNVNGEEIYRKDNRSATFTPTEIAFWLDNKKLGYFKGDYINISGGIQLGDWVIDPTNGLSIKYGGA